MFGIACADCPLRGGTPRPKGAAPSNCTNTICCSVRTRERAADDDFQATYRRHRPMVERSIAWLTRGNRRVPYRGTVKNNAWLHHRVAALNLRRLLTLGLSYHEQGWAFA